MDISIPFGDDALALTLPDARVRGVLRSGLRAAGTKETQEEIVRAALGNPIGSPRASELARGKKHIVVITSDQTRPVPSRVTLPLLLEELRLGAPDADITILIAAGCHRAMTRAEMEERFGAEIAAREKFHVHDCDRDGMRSIGALPSGGDCVINSIVLDADLVVAEGFIEPHFFAGFSGGRKAVLPGCAGRSTVLANHCAEFIANENARAGKLDGNPVHTDMIVAARRAGLAFILNVVLGEDKGIVAAFAGDADRAHRAGCDFIAERVRVKPAPADIVVTSNGGHPLDQNIYQAVKSMTAAEACVRRGGVIVVAAECRDGHGGDAFANAFAALPSPAEVLRDILSRGRDRTEPDQWQIQIFCRVLLRAAVVMTTGAGAPREMVERLGMRWAPSLDGALDAAADILGDASAGVTVIPDGVGVIVGD